MFHFPFYHNYPIQVKYLFGISAGTNRLNKFLPFNYIIPNCITFFKFIKNYNFIRMKNYQNSYVMSSC